MPIDEKSLLKEIEAHRKALKKDPASKEFLPLAEALRKLKKYDEAIEVCKSGIEKNPKYITGFIALVKILIDAGKIENALEEAERGLKISPDNTTLLRLKGEIEIKLGKKESALKTLERCYELSPDEPGLESLIKNLKDEILREREVSEEYKPEHEEKVEEVKQEEAFEESTSDETKAVREEIFKPETSEIEGVKETEEITPSESEEVKEEFPEPEEEAGTITEEEIVSEEIKPVEEKEEISSESVKIEEPEKVVETPSVDVEPLEIEEAKEIEPEEEERVTDETKFSEKYEEISISSPAREPPVVIKEIKKKFDVQEAIGFAIVMEKEGNLKSALELWIDVLKHDPSNIEAKKKVAELRKKMWKDKEEKKDKKGEIPDNLKLLAKWIKKIKEGG